MNPERILTKQSTSKNAGRAFSLIELLVVIAIVALLTSVAAPSVSSVIAGSNLNRAGQLVNDQLAIARQEAVTKNCDIHVRFFTINSGNQSGIRGIQLWRVEEGATGPVTNAFGRMVLLPEGVLINPANTLSPLLTLSSAAGGSSGTMNLPTYGNASYTGFRIRANGTLDKTVAANNFLTIQNANPPPSANVPDNYYTLQVNPITGKVLSYRP